VASIESLLEIGQRHYAPRQLKLEHIVCGFFPQSVEPREFERWLTQDAGLTRSQARAVIRFGHKGLTMQDAAAGHPRDRLVTQIEEATRLLRST
jgi:hypothetical protein